MHPAFSVLFLTTLIGVGQGLFIALYTVQVYATIYLLPQPSGGFYALGSLIALAFLIGGLVASFFHLGRPERAWRSATRWRTSWLSREVIVLPALMGAVFVYGVLHFLGWDLSVIGIRTAIPNDLTLFVGAGGVLLAFLLYLCTGMIYACLKFLREWASWLTVVNYTLFGLASGFLFAAAYSAWLAPQLTYFYGVWALIATAAVMVTRVASLIRNARLRPISTLQTAIGVRHARITQRAQGFMGGSFNTREFFHNAPRWAFRSVKWVFLVLVFPIPAVLIWAGLSWHAVGLAAGGTVLIAAFLVQYLGLLAERWFFFAQANHPQNLYYQVVS